MQLIQSASLLLRESKDKLILVFIWSTYTATCGLGQHKFFTKIFSRQFSNRKEVLIHTVFQYFSVVQNCFLSKSYRAHWDKQEDKFSFWPDEQRTIYISRWKSKSPQVCIILPNQGIHKHVETLAEASYLNQEQ